jgi:polyisoprenoid-binding protein YceI
MSAISTLLGDAVGRWTLVPDRSTFVFRNKTMWGAMTVKGQFAEVRGEGQVTDEGAVSGRIDIVAASLHTGIGKRDDHLRSVDFFEVERFPEFSVIVSAADPADGDAVDLHADIVIKGTSHPLPLRATVAVLEDRAVRVSTRTSVDREELGVSGNLLGMLVGATELSADAVFVRGSLKRSDGGQKRGRRQSRAGRSRRSTPRCARHGQRPCH